MYESKNKNQAKSGDVCVENQKILQNLSKAYYQSFESIVPTYIYDKKDDRLIEAGFRDVQKEIDSHKECALDFMLDKFLDPIKNANVQLVDGVAEVSHLDLIDLADISSQKEELAIKYGLTKEASLNDVYEAIKKSISNIKEDKNNEKEIE